MSEQKHTPGPWIRSLHGFQVLTGDSRRSICELPGRVSEQEQIANARLIAAAPEMLAACEAAERHLNFSTTAAKELKKQLRAAIAKAKGQQGGSAATEQS